MREYSEDVVRAVKPSPFSPSRCAPHLDAQTAESCFVTPSGKKASSCRLFAAAGHGNPQLAEDQHAAPEGVHPEQSVGAATVGRRPERQIESGSRTAAHHRDRWNPPDMFD